MTELNVVASEETTYCAVHPDRETGLRCITCNRLMCVDCVVRTPVGYRCRECVRGQQAVFFKANTSDDAITFAVCAVLTGIAAAILSRLGLGLWIALFVGLPLGGAIGEAALRATKRRRSRNSHILAGAGVVIGGVGGVVLMMVLTYNDSIAQALAQIPPEARGGVVIPPLTLNTILQSLTSDFGTLLLIGLIAAAVYGRYRMKL